MNSYRELQQIYEGGWRGDSLNVNPNRGYKADQSKHSYRKGDLPVNSGGSDNAYARFAANNPSTPTPVSDEEEPTHRGVIQKSKILNKIDDLMSAASTDGMDYALHSLGMLKSFIESQK